MPYSTENHRPQVARSRVNTLNTVTAISNFAVRKIDLCVQEMLGKFNAIQNLHPL